MASERLLPSTAPSPEEELSGSVGTRWKHGDPHHRRDISRSPNERLNPPTHFTTTTRYDREGPHPKEVSPITQQEYMQKKLVKTRGYHLQPPPSFNTEDISHVAASTENISNARHLDSSEVPSHSRMSRSPYSPPPPRTHRISVWLRLETRHLLRESPQTTHQRAWTWRVAIQCRR